MSATCFTSRRFSWLRISSRAVHSRCVRVLFHPSARSSAISSFALCRASGAERRRVRRARARACAGLRASPRSGARRSPSAARTPSRGSARAPPRARPSAPRARRSAPRATRAPSSSRRCAAATSSRRRGRPPRAASRAPPSRAASAAPPPAPRAPRRAALPRLAALVSTASTCAARASARSAARRCAECSSMMSDIAQIVVPGAAWSSARTSLAARALLLGRLVSSYRCLCMSESTLMLAADAPPDAPASGDLLLTSDAILAALPVTPQLDAPPRRGRAAGDLRRR